MAYTDQENRGSQIGYLARRLLLVVSECTNRKSMADGHDVDIETTDVFKEDMSAQGNLHFRSAQAVFYLSQS